MDTEFIGQVLKIGLAPPAYLAVMEQRAALDPGALEGEEAERAAFAKLNLHRIGRIMRSWRPSEKLTSLVVGIDQPQLWMVLTEPWCGDSAQCLPCLEILAASHPLLTICYVLRDDHPGIMNRYLTNGKQSIPVVVAFNDEGRELFRWGPRPAEAQVVFDAATAQGLEKPAKLEKLHLFYGRDRGRALDAELVALLGRLPDGPS